MLKCPAILLVQRSNTIQKNNHLLKGSNPRTYRTIMKWRRKLKTKLNRRVIKTLRMPSSLISKACILTRTVKLKMHVGLRELAMMCRAMDRISEANSARRRVNRWAERSLLMTSTWAKHRTKMIAIVSREEDKLSRFLNTMTTVAKTKTESSHIEAVLKRSLVVLEKLLTYREITKKMTVEAT